MTNSDNSFRLLFFSGLAAGPEVFSGLKIAFPNLKVFEWPTPCSSESLSEYCAKLASSIEDPKHTILGGASFGGIVASLVAQMTQPAAVILIGSLKYPSELPWYVRMLRPLACLTGFIPVRVLKFTVKVCLRWNLLPTRLKHIKPVAQQFLDCDPTLFCWSLKQLLRWREIPKLDCPIYHIHGGKDRVLPVHLTNPDAIIQDGGHVISMSHSEQVCEFISLAI